MKNKIRNKIRSEKGSITVYVIITMLFFSVFIMSIYIMNSRKYEAQLEAHTKVTEIYEQEGAEELFSEHFASEDEKIPIYTADQLLSIGTGDCIYIPQEKKMYIFVDEVDKYVIENNITGLNPTTLNGMKEKIQRLVENYGTGEGNYLAGTENVLKNQ